jgi:hypothetical protein
MLTRDYIVHPYRPFPPDLLNTPGYIRVVRQNNITQTWAVSRPGSAPEPLGAPFYLHETMSPQGGLIRTGVMPLMPSRPRVQMDPSDPSTWQRQYRFTQ